MGFINFAITQWEKTTVETFLQCCRNLKEPQVTQKSTV